MNNKEKLEWQVLSQVTAEFNRLCHQSNATMTLQNFIKILKKTGENELTQFSDREIIEIGFDAVQAMSPTQFEKHAKTLL